jgi:hypothetical protein
MRRIGIEYALNVSVQRSHAPMRANIVGPPSVATSIKASMAACHSAAVCSTFVKRAHLASGN